jgi:hypothetical protein
MQERNASLSRFNLATNRFGAITWPRRFSTARAAKRSPREASKVSLSDDGEAAAAAWCASTRSRNGRQKNRA